LKKLPVSNLDEAVIIALGGNMPGDYGSSEALLDKAIDTLATRGLNVIARSGWWRSNAWPDPTQPAYTNGVVIVETSLAPLQVMAALHDLEGSFGRLRGRRNNESRTLDLDLIAYGRLVGEMNGLLIPHPRAAERLFVMGPLAQVAPGWTDPINGETAAALASKARVGADARPL
jgi:2-amino-4-hydroxy-6-hydroxymethyldihydropteridine diphosphokinase